MTKAVSRTEKNIQRLHIFDTALISGNYGSKIEKKYVMPIATNPQIEIYAFHPDNFIHADILNLIKQTFSLCENDIGYINLRRKVCITKPKIFWKPQIRRLCISFPMQGNLQENIVLRIMMIQKEKMRF